MSCSSSIVQVVLRFHVVVELLSLLYFGVTYKFLHVFEGASLYLGYMVYEYPLDVLWWRAHWRWLTKWLLTSVGCACMKLFYGVLEIFRQPSTFFMLSTWRLVSFLRGYWALVPDFKSLLMVYVIHPILIGLSWCKG